MGKGGRFLSPRGGLSCPQAAKETENGTIIIIIVGLGLIIFLGNSLRTPIWEIVFAIKGGYCPLHFTVTGAKKHIYLLVKSN